MSRIETRRTHPLPTRGVQSLSGATTVWALRIGETVTWIAKVNLAWMLVTVLGGVVLGFAPAAFATAELCRSRLRSGHDARLRDFITAGRRQFWRANAILLPVVVVDVLLATALTLAAQSGSVLAAMAVGIVVLIAVLATVLLPVLYANYDIPLARYVPTATRFVLANPVSMLLLALTCAAVALASALLPALVPFVSVGAWMQFSSALCLSFFHANDQRVAATAEEDGGS
ncbi:DUF624 domain-containing protein [Rathayibacter sp. KR2-224]|uniref:DUF624 domain-containing protein n=1 Tax=Rathayibacter sp. KR2-224 TaxID=3400913 RepID=UPI003C0D3EF8